MLTGKSLTGQVAIVTGASRGIGKAVAQALAAEGATVIINYNGSAEAAEVVAADIRSQGGMAEAVKCNVADFAESEAFVKAVTEEYGRVDILVNNAGITRDNLIVRMTEEEFNAVLDTNLKGASHDPASDEDLYEAEIWENHQYLFCQWHRRECRAG